MAFSKNEPSFDSAEEINILLLGESGVGKSTFINSCFNYLKYRTLDEVMNNALQVLIPARIRMLDIDGKEEIRDIKVNDDLSQPDDVANEVLEAAEAATQNVRTYVFPICINKKIYKIRFLDTPGIGDKRGIDQDQMNCDLILNYISQFKEIHGFGILIHPFKNRLDVFLNYCLVQILSRLENSAVENVAFIFTNTRGQNFKPGPTYTSLNVLLNQIKEKNNLSIPLTKQNMFCFDNEAFSYAAAIKHGVKLESFIYRNTEDSWKVSVAEFWRLLDYVIKLKPHDLKKTISVNDARTMASYLTEPVIEIVQLIQNNITKLEQHTKELEEAKLTREELMKKMHTPTIDINVENLADPYTVCTDLACTSTYEVNGIRKIHYKQVCCTKCLLKYKIVSTTLQVFMSLRKSVQDELLSCSAFEWNGQCRECKHDVSVHKQIYYKTRIFEGKADESVLPAISSQEDLMKLKEGRIKSLKERQKEFEYERQYILQSCALLDQYLQMNTVTTIESPIEGYLKCQIIRENTIGKGDTDKTVNSLRVLLATYEKENMNVKAGRSVQNRNITPEEIEEIKTKLMNLKHFGPRIKQLYDLHKAGRNKALKKNEKIVQDGPQAFFQKCQDFLGL